MRRFRDKTNQYRRSAQPTIKPIDPAGSWLPWPQAEALCRLDLKAPSHWKVLLAVLLTSKRYGGQDARLGVKDLVRMTGLSTRTVKGALTTLIGHNLLVRVGRYRCLRVTLDGESRVVNAASSAAESVDSRRNRGGADKLAPPESHQGGADKLAPRLLVLMFLLLKKKRSTGGAFTNHQKDLVTDVLTETATLLGTGSVHLPLPAKVAAQLGLSPETDFTSAMDFVARSGDPVKAHCFTKAVLALRDDERVHGRELDLLV